MADDDVGLSFFASEYAFKDIQGDLIAVLANLVQQNVYRRLWS